MQTPPLTPLLAVGSSSDALSAGVHEALARPAEKAPAPKRRRCIQLPLHPPVNALMAPAATAPAAIAPGTDGPALVADATMFAFDEDV